MIEQGERDELVKALNRFNDKAEQVIRSNSSASTINVTAGGMGLWVSVTCCLMMFSGLLVGSIWLSLELARIDRRSAEQEVKIDRSNTFLSAIWAQAPELEKKIKSEEEKE